MMQPPKQRTQQQHWRQRWQPATHATGDDNKGSFDDSNANGDAKGSCGSNAAT
jgi:hypothetical protein